MVTVCAWCQKILKVTTDHVDLVSHGICDKCATREILKYEADRKGAKRA